MITSISAGEALVWFRPGRGDLKAPWVGRESDLEISRTDPGIAKDKVNEYK